MKIINHHDVGILLNIGSGIYVQLSRDVSTAPVVNNSFVIARSKQCGYRCSETVLDLYCYSNSTSQSVGYFKFPNDHSYYSSEYGYSLQRQTYSAMRMYIHVGYRSYSSGQIWGIFTCELPDTEGNTVETSIGIYSSMPSK